MNTILLVDDNPFNREGMGLYLQQHGFTVLEAGDAQNAWTLAETHPLYAAVIDIVIPATPNASIKLKESAGVTLAIRLKKKYPSLGIVLFSAYEDRGDDVFSLVQQGARGIAYKLKGCRPSALLKAITAVCAGQVIIDPEISNLRSLAASFTARLGNQEIFWIKQAADRFDLLSPREMETAQRIAAAHTAERIAAALVVTPKTVENYTNRIYHKLGLNGLGHKAPQLRKIVILAKACMLYDLRKE